jgi:uncharacterized protein DUF6882
MSDPDTTVDCDRHGSSSPAAFACRHVIDGTDRGFHTGYAPETPDDPWPDAWCDRCERLLDSEGRWTDSMTAFADVGLLCIRCYETVRERNWRQDDEAFELLLEDAIRYLEEVQAALQRDFPIGRYERYDWNQGAGTLVFSQAGQPAVVADVQFVGSVSKASGTWLWSWANGSILEPVKARVREVRAHGEERRFLKLASARWEATEEDGWEMVAIAAYLLGARGAYRSPDGANFTFLAITEVRWAQ